MTTATAARSGKGHKDENFPVASRLVSPRHRGPILAFYRFVRAADDVADHPTLAPDEKLRLLDALEAALTGKGPADPEAEPLRQALAERGLSPRHAQDLLDAFRQDARKTRYADWGELMGYCALSAMPVGRFVLDVHGEDRRSWAASDPLCAALQVINHLQDCAKDYRSLDRVYLPADALLRHGARIEELAAGKASPALLAVIRELNDSCAGLLRQSAAFPSIIADRRLALEVAVIQSLAGSLVRKLRTHDPLSERVHATKPEALIAAAAGVMKAILQRTGRRSGRAQAKLTP
ncbi:squalene synthase HpnC [Enterovirga aerilata]|uniref:Squalene synthase HpnC n=1 Tax=Enterovirga aerilata TaxID=2730920 RepID=A0A849I6W7_9HYPH|nr:squalene synthase HpnC [Enterovirga sp. DB1703]